MTHGREWTSAQVLQSGVRLGASASLSRAQYLTSGSLSHPINCSQDHLVNNTSIHTMAVSAPTSVVLGSSAVEMRKTTMPTWSIDVSIAGLRKRC